MTAKICDLVKQISTKTKQTKGLIINNTFDLPLEKQLFVMNKVIPMFHEEIHVGNVVHSLMDYSFYHIHHFQLVKFLFEFLNKEKVVSAIPISLKTETPWNCVHCK